MFTAVFRNVARLALYGLVVFAFVLVAHVNVDDLRYKLGQLLKPNDPTVKVGGLYVVSPDGNVQPGPPVCAPDEQLLAAHFQTESNKIKLRNNLGYHVPLISQISNFLVAGDGGGSSVTVVNVSGHTLVADDVANTQLRAEASINEYIGTMYQNSVWCERVVRKHWDDGECVALVHRVSKSGGRILGYAFNRGCLLPQLTDWSFDKRRLDVPQPRWGITARLAQIKDYIGLLTYEQPTEVQAANAAAG